MDLKRFSKFIPFCLGYFSEIHTLFSFVPLPLSFIRPNFLGEVSCQNFFLPKGEIIPEIYSSYKGTNQVNKMTLWYLSFVASLMVLEIILEIWSVVPIELCTPSLWAKSPTDVDKFCSRPPIKIQIDFSKPLPRSNQYSIRSPLRHKVNNRKLQDSDLSVPCTRLL